MRLRYCIEADDRILRQIMNNLFALFGGKCVLFSGDFRHILPVVPKASQGMIVQLCLKSSHLFNGLHVLHLTENVRLKLLKANPNADSSAIQYPEYLLSVWEGRTTQDEDSFIDLSPSISVVRSTAELIDLIFDDIKEKHSDTEWLTSRAILATTN